jgi:acetolactate synthase-1/2/3 large subunit
MTVAEYIIKYLEDAGVTHIFYVSGGQSMYLVDALNKSKKITAVHMMHEHSACVAAMGYAQYKNELGVALVTAGPGALNCVNAVAAAYIDSVPLLVISGQDKTFRLKTNERSKGVNEVDIAEIVKSITKSVTTFRRERILDAYFPMVDRKGPVWLEIPLDIQNEEIKEI